jgi:hypothetical protein
MAADYYGRCEDENPDALEKTPRQTVDEMSRGAFEKCTSMFR